MVVISSSSLVEMLRQVRLLDSDQLQELVALQARFPDPKALAGELIRQGWLSPYQANQLLQGKGHELLLGSYVLLEKLGEGGMGAVFKAKNWKLGRIVAIKLIRKERLDNPDAIRRFEREVRSAAALSHPNIVHAFDADQIGGTHLLVMEYVEGATDLARLVKQNGPLPVSQACEHVRQAALGLQHAFERGMVHRDIKPANLLLTADGRTVKVLDLGLARLDRAGVEDGQSSTMTQEGAIMGTPDYIAPEQALESHTVDIRADLYSLGCTLYYLLTSKAPFPGGSLTDKLLRHQLHEPQPVEQLRPDVPPGVAAMVRKLMAKKPEHRYQTPADVAAALACVSGAGGVDERTVAEGSRIAAVTEASGDTLDSPFASLRTDMVNSVDSTQSQRREARERRLLLYGLAGGSLVFVGLIVGLLVFLRTQSAENQPLMMNEDRQIVTATPPLKAPEKVDEAWLKQVAALPAEKQGEAVTAKLMELNPGFDGKVTPRIEGGVVTLFGFSTDEVTDLSPVRALAGVRTLNCSGSGGRKGKLADLTPLKDMKLAVLNVRDTQVSDLSPLTGVPLTNLSCTATKVADLSPLKGTKLTHLDVFYTLVSDLSPLKGMKLISFSCGGTKVADLSPLKDMKLTSLNVWGTQVTDLSPLKGMPLRSLTCGGTKVADLSPLKEAPLRGLNCDIKPERDAEVLRSIKTLETINGKPAAEFWKEVGAK